MAPSTFHPFLRLPPELRLEIWELAIRPPCSGVHYFSVFDKRREPTDSPLRDIALKTRNPCEYSPDDSYTAAPPEVPDRPSEYSWTKRNRSLYLWDAGLWMACKESKHVIMKHFDVHRWDAKRRQTVKEETILAARAESEKMTTIVGARQDGIERHLMVRPYKDLFYLDLRLLANAEDKHAEPFDWLDMLYDIPFSTPRCGFFNVTHIAVEFEPSWCTHLPENAVQLTTEPTTRGFVARFLSDCLNPREMRSPLWLVDHDLRLPKTALQPPDGQLPIFHDLDQKRYFVPRKEDLDDYYWLRHSEYNFSSHRFVDWLAGFSDMYSEVWGEDGEEFDVDAHLGLLARVESCVDVDNDGNEDQGREVPFDPEDDLAVERYFINMGES